MRGTTILATYVTASKRADFWMRAWDTSYRLHGAVGANADALLRYSRYIELADKCMRRLSPILDKEIA